MKISVIRAIREPKYKLCSTLTDITDFTDMEPCEALGDDENLCNLCHP